MQSSSQDENVVADEQQEGMVGSADSFCLAGAASLQDIRTRGGRGGRGVSVTRVPLIR